MHILNLKKKTEQNKAVVPESITQDYTYQLK